MDNLFDIEKLTVHARHKCLLDVERLSLPRGRLIALIGANGAGKSTLLHALLGQITSLKVLGQIRCLGQPVAQMVAQGKIAWVGQHEVFELPLTVLDYALLGVTPRLLWYQKPSQQDVTKAKDYLDQFDLAHLIDKRISSLSGGEKQRLAIVRALMQGTEVLLLDEPSNHLDVKHERQLFAHLRRLVDEQQKSIVVVLHSLTNAHRFADEVVAVHQGKILAQGLPDTVMTADLMHRLYDVQINRYQTDQGVIFM